MKFVIAEKDLLLTVASSIYASMQAHHGSETCDSDEDFFADDKIAQTALRKAIIFIRAADELLERPPSIYAQDSNPNVN